MEHGTARLTGPLRRRKVCFVRLAALFGNGEGMNARPVRGYLVCGEPRCGSSLLCRTLGSTGLLGRPAEYFRHPEMRARLRGDCAAAVGALLETATTPNGVYGIKIFSHQFDTMTGSGWIGHMPGLHFIQLERRDLLGQAISYVRAMQTGRFISARAETRPPEYDRRAIAGQISRLAAAGARWRSYFARNGIEPLSLVYEEMIADTAGTVGRVAALLGLAETPGIDRSKVDVEIQRDEVSAEWRRRFVAESGGLDRLDDWPFGPFRRGLRAARDRAGGGSDSAARPNRPIAVPPADKAR